MTPTDTRAALAIVLALAETLRDLKTVPSGHFYARLLTMPGLAQLTVGQYQQLIGTLKGAGLIAERAHQLVWTGPAAERR